jgi:glycosyltransferase involved in cell wall biosynthesis
MARLTTPDTVPARRFRPARLLAPGPALTPAVPPAVTGLRAAGPGRRPLRVATVIARLEGGAGVLALRGALAAQGPGCTQTIITGQGDQLVAAARAGGLEVVIEPSLRAPIRPVSDARALARLTVLFARRGFDVVHTHCAKAGAVGRMAAARAGGSRIVHTYHGFPFHQFQPAALRQAYVSIERRLGRVTDTALCVGSGVAAEAVRRRLVAPERVQTIGVCVDGPDRARASAAAGSPAARLSARASLGLPADAVVVGAVGRLTYQKAPEDFVTAVAGLNRPGVIGAWVGGGELSGQVARQAAASARSTASACGAGSQVVLTGERSDILDILPAFDVFALPSRYEGLPTAVVEAMICGIPVVATAVNAVPDLVLAGETGLLVPPGRPRLLTDAVARLLDSPGEAAAMAAAARARVSGRYTEPALRDALLGAYDRASPRGGRDPHVWATEKA